MKEAIKKVRADTIAECREIFRKYGDLDPSAINAKLSDLKLYEPNREARQLSYFNQP